MPFQSQALRAGPNVTNVILQDHCPTPVEHVGIIYDPGAIEWTLDALGRPGPADPAFAPSCIGLARTPGSSVGEDPPAGSAAAPQLRLGARRTLRVRGDRARIAAHCLSEMVPCRGRLEYVSRGIRRGVRSFAIAPGQRVHVSVPLNRAGRRALRSDRRERVRARAILALPGGSATAVRRTVTLRR